jgi:hypothetical protein
MLMRSLVPSLALVLPLALQAADDVTIRDFSITPMGNLTALDGSLELHPKAKAGYAYDSNIYNAPSDKQHATFASGTVGLDLRWLATREDKVTLASEISGDRYPSHSDRNTYSGSAVAGIVHDGPRIGGTADAGYTRREDPLIETGERIRVNVYNADAQVDWKALVSTWSLGGKALREDYLEPFSGFSADDRDNDRGSAYVRYGWQYKDGSEIYGRLIGSRTRYYHDSNAFNNSTGLGGVLGWRYQAASKTSILAEAGAERRSYSDEFAPTYDDRTAFAPIGSLAATYTWGERSDATLRGFSEIRDSMTANSALYYGISLGARQRVFTKAGVFGGVMLSNFADMAAAAGSDREQRITNTLNAGVEYRLRDGVALRLKTTYENSHARLGDDYDRYTVGLDLGVVL